MSTTWCMASEVCTIPVAAPVCAVRGGRCAKRACGAMPVRAVSHSHTVSGAVPVTGMN
jgi:hypothetical protein